MTSPSFGYGVYAGPDSKGVTGAADFDSQMGTTSTHVLDFTPTNDWSQIEGQSWLLQPHAGQLARLELSIPVVPSITGASLSACAQGQYNSHWTALGRNLVYYGLANTIVRPGWEFNGNWYAWSAASQPATFAECFRQVVTTMRAVTGARFAFDWNVANGPQAFDATLAWPGASYVDYVGVDVYDTSWVHYSSTSPITSAQQAATINDLINGKYGLAFWANFAQQQGRPMAVTEWGVTWRSDGHGGGDDPSFVDAMFSFFADSTHNVAYEDYFNTASSTTDHVLTGLTRFPLSAAEFKAKVAAG